MSQSSVILNPLREGLTMERAGEPCAMVILGAHGDLTKRKLLPALYALYREGSLPSRCAIVGMSRTGMNHEQFRQMIRESIGRFAPDLTVDDDGWARFSALLYYVSGEFGKLEGFENLSKLLDDIADKHGTQKNHIFYLSTPPSLYSTIVEKLAESGLAELNRGKGASWPRIVVEKPFGCDLQSARSLNEEIHRVFEERQIFRIDHYLGKETVQNIMVLRFANGIFEPLWNRQHIDHVQITNAETLGVEGRGAYYEEAGALRDMIQNHMMQLVSLVAMEPPVSLSADDIRNEKAKVLHSIRPFDRLNLDSLVVRGQYGPGWIAGEKVAGYRDEPNVAAQSTTDTFVALRLFVDNWRWADVPFYVRSGKRLGKSTTEIAIHFRKAPHRLFRTGVHDVPENLSPNVLVLQIQPDEGISLKFATKLPGLTTQLRWLSMDFRYGTAFGGRTPSAYERLVLDCFLGDAALFARSDEVEASWELIEPIIEGWADCTSPEFPNYVAGSWGPESSNTLIESTGHAWRRL